MLALALTKGWFDDALKQELARRKPYAHIPTHLLSDFLRHPLTRTGA